LSYAPIRTSMECAFHTLQRLMSSLRTRLYAFWAWGWWVAKTKTPETWSG